MKKLLTISALLIFIALTALIMLSFFSVMEREDLNTLAEQFNLQLKNKEYLDAYTLYSSADVETQSELDKYLNGYASLISDEAYSSSSCDELDMFQAAGWDVKLINDTEDTIKAEMAALLASNEAYDKGYKHYLNREFEEAKELFDAVIEDDENYVHAQKYSSEINTRIQSWSENVSGRNYYNDAICADDEYMYIPFVLDGIDGIYKIDMNLNAVDFFPLSDDAGKLVITGLNIVGDYLYFIAGENIGSGYTFKDPYCIYEMKTDGSDLTLIKSGNYKDLFIKGSKVYAISREFGLIEYDKDFDEPKVINANNIYDFSFCDEGIYYTVQQDLTHDNDNVLYFYDGSSSIVIEENEYLKYYRFQDKYIRCWQSGTDFEMLMYYDGEKETKVLNGDVYNVYCLNDNKIIYSINWVNGREKLVSYDLESKKTTELAEVMEFYDYIIEGIAYDNDKIVVERNGELNFADMDFSDWKSIGEIEINHEELTENKKIINHLEDKDIFLNTDDGEIISVITDKQIWHYKDNRLNVTIEKRYIDEYDCNVYVTHIFTKDNTLFATGNANPNSTTSDKTYGAKYISNIYSMIYAQNTDTFLAGSNYDKGIIIREGRIIRSKLKQDMIAYFDDGSMEVYFKDDDITAQELIDMGAVSSFSFGPILMRDYGIYYNSAKYALAGRNPRSAIGYVEPGHYVMVACDGRDKKVSRGLCMLQLAKVFEGEGCKTAYNLDGGMTTTVLFMGNYVTYRPPSSSSEWFFYRKVAEMLYFGSNELSPLDLNDYKYEYDEYSQTFYN